jgi:general secretion pathway protein C
MQRQKIKGNKGLLHQSRRFLPYLIVLFIGFTLADLVILNYRHLMLPDQAPPTRPPLPLGDESASRSSYVSITSRNIFSADGLIPDPLVSKDSPQNQQDQAPVLSSLPLTLMGTIVHSNPEKSIANIEIKSKNQVLPFQVGRDIEGLATLTRVERGKIIFRNSNNGRLEYVEMKIQGQKLTFQGAKSTQVSGGEVAQVAPNKFEIKRSDLNRYLADMSAVLQQASMSPRRNASGEIECFRFNAITPGSIYTQLGMQNGDCIKEVNGVRIESAAQAMDMYGKLRNESAISLGFERDGRDQTSSYSIR